MQDLEDLKKELKSNGGTNLRWESGLLLIDRLQAAEKDNQDLRMQAIIDFGQYQTAHDELKALREQKPISIELLKRAFSMGEQAGVYGESERKSHWDKATKIEEDFKKLLDSVAQSRDSAEPVITDHQGRPMTYWGGKSNANDHIAEPSKMVEAKQSEPAYKDSDGYVIGENYEHGLWSRRNIEAFIADGNSVEAKQAVPDGFTVEVIDHPNKYGFNIRGKGYGYCVWKDDLTLLWHFFDAMLAAAPQVSAEQPKGAAPEQNNDLPMTWKSRFTSALEILTGEQFSDKLVDDWISGESDLLQDAIGGHSPWWCQNIGIVDAATAMADEAIEGEPERICYDRPLSHPWVGQSPAPKAQCDELLQAAISYVGQGDDVRIGWIGRSPSHKNLFQCERCGAEHEDCTLIPHHNSCSAIRLLSAIVKADSAGGGE